MGPEVYQNSKIKRKQQQNTKIFLNSTWAFSSFFFFFDLELSGNFGIHGKGMIPICKEKVSLC